MGKGKRECWAKRIGGCDGKLSKEHYQTKGLFEGEFAYVRGLPHCEDDYMKVPLSGLVTRILCEHHNNILTVADQAAIDLKRAWLECTTPVAKPPSSIVEIEVSGALFSRWLCKMACNIMTMGKVTLHDGFVRHAFGVPTEQPMSFYISMPKNKKLPVDPNKTLFWTLFDEQDGSLCFYCCFYGMHWFASEGDLKQWSDITVVGVGSFSTKDLSKRKSIQFGEADDKGKPTITHRLLIRWGGASNCL